MSGNTNTYVARGEICMMAGERAAMIYERIRYMAEQNALQGQNMREDRAWIVNSIQDWERFFPWLSYKQIRTALEKLRDLDLVSVCQPKASQGDNTFWYSPAEEPQDVAPPSAQKGRGASAQKGTSGSAQKGKPSAQKGTSIKNKIHQKDIDTVTPLSPIDILCQVLRRETAEDFAEHRKSLKKPLTQGAAKRLARSVQNHPDPDSVFDESIANGWQGVFPERKSNGQRPYASNPQSDPAIRAITAAATAFEA